jgi:hypothetical protein
MIHPEALAIVKTWRCEIVGESHNLVILFLSMLLSGGELGTINLRVVGSKKNNGFFKLGEVELVNLSSSSNTDKYLDQSIVLLSLG